MKATAKIVRINSRYPESAVIARAAALVQEGGVVVFPTRGLYGLGADAFNAMAVERIFNIKDRDPGKPLLVLVDNPSRMDRLVQSPSAMARHLMAAFWPGRATFVMSAQPGLPRGLSGGTGKIGIRWTSHPVAGALIKAAQVPLTGTSANISGAGGCASMASLDPAIMEAADMILDAGMLEGGRGSTVVDVTGAEPVVLREGTIPAEDVMAVFYQIVRQSAKHVDKPC